MALYISAGRRRRTTTLIAVAALVVGAAGGVLIGRSTAPTVDDRVAEARAAGRRFASSLRVLPLEYEQAVTDQGEAADAQHTIDRSLNGVHSAVDAAPWLTDAQMTELADQLAVIRSAPVDELSPAEFESAVDTAAGTVESLFGVAGTASPG